MKNNILKILLFIALLIALVAGRGFWLADIMDGRYRLSSLLFEATAFALVVLLLTVFNYGVKRSLNGLFKKNQRCTASLPICFICLLFLPLPGHSFW